MRYPFIKSSSAMIILSLAVSSALAVPLDGNLNIDAGTKGTDWYTKDPDTGDNIPANEGDAGAYTLYLNGSFFTMAKPPNPNHAVMISPGATAAIILGTSQNFVLDPDEPHPQGHPDAPYGAGSGYGTALVSESGVLAPFEFFNNPTYVGINPIGYQSGEVHPAAGADVDLDSCVDNVCDMTAELSGWEVMWNGTAFEQGPRPDNTLPFELANGSYNLLTNFYSLQWSSQIKGGSFDSITGTWRIEGTHGQFVSLPSSNDGNVSVVVGIDMVTTESALISAGIAQDEGMLVNCTPDCVDISSPVNAGIATVVIPMTDVIVADSILRLRINDEWVDFDTSNGDTIASAPGTLGSCNPPGSLIYTIRPLTAGDFCLQLRIADGGVNDADAIVDQVSILAGLSQGVVIPVEPVTPTPTPAKSSDSGSVNIWLMLSVMCGLGMVRLARK